MLGVAVTITAGLGWLLADVAVPPQDRTAASLAEPDEPLATALLAQAPEQAAIPLEDVVTDEPGAVEPPPGDGRAARRPIPGTERAWREAFVLELRKPGVDVDKLFDTTIHGRGPDAEKVALLRALLDMRSPKALGALVTAAEEAEPHDGPAGAGVPEFCVRTLSERAPRDADARAALGQLVARRGSALEPRLRRTAAACVALTGTAAELAQLAADIRGCGDPELLLGVARSLEHNPDAATARGWFSDLPPVAADGEEQRLARN